jgi:hypothetical protein
MYKKKKEEISMDIDIIIWIAACVFCLIVLILLWHDGIFDYVDDGCDEAMAGAIETLKKKKEE